MTLVDLYTGPWYGPSNHQGKKATHGKPIIAIKRTVSRARPDLFPWAEFNADYNRRLERALAQIQREHEILGTGQLGEPTFRLLQKLHRQEHPHEMAMDNVAINLFEDEWGRLHPPVLPIKKVHDAIAEYWRGAVAYNSIWHYLQRRPFRTLGRAPHSGGYSDCSEMTTAALYYVRLATGIYVPDPNGRGYDGWGNSDTQWATNKTRRVLDGHYEIGDIGVFGPEWHTRHVVMCFEPGPPSVAVFGSNGSEAAPNETRIYYRSDLLGVVRPILIPAHH